MTDPGPPADARIATGVVVAVEATGLERRQRVHDPDGRPADRSTFRVGTIENATQFPPGHLAEHKVSRASRFASGPGPTAAPSRSGSRTRPSRRPVGAGADDRLRSPSARRRDRHLGRARTTPFRSTDEDPRLRQEPARRRRSTWSWLSRRGRAGASRRVVELVRLDVDERHVRVRGGDRLDLSSVGPHWLAVQNFGVAKTGRTACARRARRLGGLVEGRIGFVSVEIFATSPPTSASVGVLTAGACSPSRRPCASSGR